MSRIIATLIIVLSIAAPASAAQFAPPPEVPIYEGTRIKVAPENGPVLSERGASILSREHEAHYWHNWHVPLRYGHCQRRTRRLVQCSVQAYLGILAGEAPHWNGYVDVVHLGLDDRAWISTIFPRPLHLTLTEPAR